MPEVKHKEWVRNPIDAFIAADHEKHGLTPRPEADKATLLRRVYFDLIGLPPTRAQLHAFLADDSPDAYEKVVDELLASPRYGERWGRHWMDVWRYSDWAGYGAEVRDSQQHIWHWRDWIVESLNADKPYDRMVTEMLAGDEIAPADPDTVRATGYLARSWYKFNRNVWMDNMVEHASKAFLGLTINCARCHDHKFDPVSQKEYYQFRAFFEPTNVRTDRLPGEPDTKKDGLPRIFDEKADAPTYLFARGDEKRPDKDHPLKPTPPAALGGSMKIETVALPPEAWYPESQPFMRDGLLAAARVEVGKAEAEAKKSDSELARAHVAAARAELASVEARLAADRAIRRPPCRRRRLARPCRGQGRAGGRGGQGGRGRTGRRAATRRRQGEGQAGRREIQEGGRRKGEAGGGPAQGARRRPRGPRHADARLHTFRSRVPQDQHRPAAGAGEMDHEPRQPAGGAGGGEPPLDAALRRAAGADGVRLRLER